MTVDTASLPGLLDGLDLIRKDFPILERSMADGQPLVYLDNATTSQKPQVVLDALIDYYERHNANVHRACTCSPRSRPRRFEGARDKVAAFINAPTPRRGDLHQERLGVAQPGGEHAGWAGEPLAVGEGDEIVITEMEHHSNIVPWQLLAQRTGAKLNWFGITDDGRLDLSNIDELITERTKIVSLTWVSNMLGTVNPVEEIVRRAQEVGALWSSTPRRPPRTCRVDVQAPGPTSWPSPATRSPARPASACCGAAARLLEELPPFLGGGEMIETVAMDSSTYAPRRTSSRPARRRSRGRRAGRGGRLPLGHRHGQHRAHEHAITEYALERLAEVPGLRFSARSTAEDRGGAISFTLGDIHPHDVGQVLDSRASPSGSGTTARGRRPRYGIPATTRASFYLYSTPAEIDALVDGSGARPELLRLRTEATWKLDSLYQESSWTTTSTRTTRACGSRRRRGAPRQPHLRRRDHAAGAVDGDAVSRTCRTRARAARSARPARPC